jgi:hypothetical protein
VCEIIVVEIEQMWKELLEERWTTHQDGPDESENTIQRVCIDVP